METALREGGAQNGFGVKWRSAAGGQTTGESRLSMRLMKTNELYRSLHDVDENKGTCAPG
jgi:hypothetical protein